MIHKISFALAFWISGAYAAHAQAIDRSVISASGNTEQTEHLQLEWTLGESITETVQAGDKILTQGFHQPLIRVERQPAESVPGTDFNVNIFPNPTRAYIQLEPSGQNDATYQVRIADVTGRILYDREYDIHQGVQSIDLGDLSSGTYIATITTAESKYPLSYKIIKTQ